MVSYASYSDTGGRSCNEDKTCVKELAGGVICAILADGLGGHGGGAAASKAAVDAVCQGWNGASSPDILTELAKNAHQAILDIQTGTCEMKSTLVVLTVNGGRIDFAHVGDSRLYHFVNGKLVFQTKDHSASQIAVILGQITPDQIRFHVDRSRLFRALGQDGELSVDAAEEELSSGRHAFLLCSDGFWEYVYESEMESALSEASSPKDWLEKMRAVHGSRIPSDNDNNSAVAVWVDIQ